MIPIVEALIFFLHGFAIRGICIPGRCLGAHRHQCICWRPVFAFVLLQPLFGHGAADNLVCLFLAGNLGIFHLIQASIRALLASTPAWFTSSQIRTCLVFCSGVSPVVADLPPWPKTKLLTRAIRRLGKGGAGQCPLCQNT